MLWQMEEEEKEQTYSGASSLTLPKINQEQPTTRSPSLLFLYSPKASSDFAPGPLMDNS